ncbi:MAG: response regulator transcription factor [Bacteroidetes bacterium]|nr:response regulator transcription factor [Bacteroidota bacterium]MBS1973712.1 response regulator transcription factor [Bacteroidota bacterium]
MEQESRIRIGLTEDNMISRKSFLSKAQMIPEWDVVFTAANGRECLEKIASQKEDSLPHVIFMDIEMPEVNGIDAISMATTLYPNIFFIALTVFDDDDKIFESIKAGACGYLLKHEEFEVLKNAVIDVLEFGGAPMSPAIARKTLNLLSKSPNIAAQGKLPMPDHLTKREKEILQYTVNGWDAKRIAAALFISTLTVRKHIDNIYHKLHVQSKAEVINMAHKNNWVE